MITEADTCRKYILPKLYGAGWTDDKISEQKSFTDGRIVVVGEKVRRRKPKRADYILRISKHFPIAVIEAKAAYKTPGAGIQQAMEYAQILNLKFAYSTNGHGIVEHDFITGAEIMIDSFPSPDELWMRYKKAEGINPEFESPLLSQYQRFSYIKVFYSTATYPNKCSAPFRCFKLILSSPTSLAQLRAHPRLSIT